MSGKKPIATAFNKEQADAWPVEEWDVQYLFPPSFFEELYSYANQRAQPQVAIAREIKLASGRTLYVSTIFPQ